MNTNLTVNPFLQIAPSNEQDNAYWLVTPKPGSGLQNLLICKPEQANLHELFLNLSQIGFNYLDCENDLSDSERELLYQSGILVEPENVPERPLFACRLDDIEAGSFEGDLSEIIVNPTFRFEPFNIANFHSWIQEKNLSPHKPTGWLKIPVTDFEIGYWLEKDEADAISKFMPGEKLSFEIEPEFLSRLLASGILTTPEILVRDERKQQERLEQAKIKYEQDKYVVLQGLLPAAQMKAMRRFYHQYVEQGFMPFGDPQVSRRYYQHKEPLAGFFHKNFCRLMSLIVGEEVIPSYVYAASYLENAVLRPHVDRKQCEFSISFQVDYRPEPEHHLSPWGLFLTSSYGAAEGRLDYRSTEFPAKSESEDKNTAVYLASGDGVIYKGRELVHYRYPLSAGHQSTSLFFHYVAKDFEGLLD